MSETRMCSKCGEIKELSLFVIDKGRAADRGNWCKKCKASNEKARQRKAKLMNEIRFKSAFNGLTSVAKKVYEVIPETTYWSPDRIASEIFRTGVKIDSSVLHGCLRSMEKSGVLIEAEGGLYSREKVAKAALKQLIEKKPQEKQAMPEENKSPIQKLRELAIELLDLGKAANTLAAKIDSSAEDVEKHIAANEQDTLKLKQLQSLLKGLA